MVEKYVIRTAICTCCYGCQLLLAAIGVYRIE